MYYNHSSGFEPLTDAELSLAREKIERMTAGGPGTKIVRDLLMRVTKLGDGQIAIRVDRPKYADRPENSSAPEWPAPRWLETTSHFVPLADGVAELLDDDGPEAELSRRRFILCDEQRQVDLANEKRAREEADAAQLRIWEREKRLAAWNALTDEEKAIKRLVAKYEDSGPPAAWNPYVIQRDSNER